MCEKHLRPPPGNEKKRIRAVLRNNTKKVMPTSIFINSSTAVNLGYCYPFSRHNLFFGSAGHYGAYENYNISKSLGDC